MSDPDDDIHEFNNGVKVYKKHLLKQQLDRYARINIHEPEEEEWFKKIFSEIDPKKGVFINIGAAIGYYVILAKCISPKLEIHAFEPLETHRQYLKDNLRLNSLAIDEITIHHEAVSSRVGNSKFYPNSYGSSLVSELHIKINNLPLERQISINCTVLNEITKKIGKIIDLIQVDVQGFEIDVLSGAVESMKSGVINRWLIGTHSLNLHTLCANVLMDQDYTVVFENFNTQHQPDGIIYARANTLQ